MNVIVIFGASGDLTSRKLIPALYNLYLKKRLPKPLHIVGFSRTPMDDNTWRSKLAETTKKFASNVFSPEQWNEFASRIHYHSGDIGNTADFQSLAEYLHSLSKDAAETNYLYYLSTAPQFYGLLTQQVGKAGLAKEPQNGNRRVIIEKPFGTDLKTAEELNRIVKENFDESQIYRIDHYLGKETVNNVLVLRFANAIFEPIWNRNYIENIQITANEDVLIGRRAPYYETAGVLRDMFQNHLLQILTFVTMEPPAVFSAKAVRDEKVKVFQSIRPMQHSDVLRNTLRGQYIGYKNEQGVAAGSRTATYGAVRLLIDNWRWKDVPVFLRSGKGMSCRTTQILIQFRCPPHSLFMSKNFPDIPLQGNRLLIQIQPAEGIQLYFMTKQPDTEMDIQMRELNFNFKDSFNGVMPDSYERLILDAIHGDASLFARSDEVEAAWKIIDPIQQVWDNKETPEPEPYEVGSIGPDSAEDWIRTFGANWFNLCPLL
ncbi:glucose-6-phosphate 1-dehydrogenase [Planctomycetales bacterium]|nr:glucose-6-phosphate 1-dehydrogenase [Planctomycetales bacterium]GHT33954.1 glucose-6-phosphate 1-dehydrogenase [Planctomycetales bacterium]